jgi:signal transduction histidine kinase
MLFEFIEQHRAELIARTRARVALRSAPRPTENELERGIPLFLDQLIDTLRLSRTTNEEMSRSAGFHGRALLRTGFTVAQVVHDYGDVCQAVTELAVEASAPITVDEFRLLNRSLDDAIAQAVTEYTAQRERTLAEEGTQRQARLVQELRGRLSTVMLSFSLLEKGHVGIGGSTGAILGSNLRHMCELLDRSFAEMRLVSGPPHLERVLVAELLEHVELDASLGANARGLALSCDPGEPGLEVKVDRQLITAALANVLRNAIELTRAGGNVSLRTSSTAERVVFEVEDECGGLAPGKLEQILLAFEPHAPTRPGPGHGLDVSRRSVEACGGTLRVRDVPGSGCVFTIDLPRSPAAG